MVHGAIGHSWLNEHFRFAVNKCINRKMASDRSSMTEAKVGPMGLQCDKLQRDDMGHYWQPLQERRRGHSKIGNTTPCLYCSDLYPNSRTCESWMYCGECGRWTHHACAGKNVAGLYARFAPTIK